MVRLLVLLPLLLAPPRPAAPPTRFSSCAAVSATAPRCHESVTYEVGRTVFLRGRVVPARPGLAHVLRRVPDGNHFVRVGRTRVDERGRIRWSWRPTPRDAEPAAPYLFAFAIPGVGRSTAVEVWVVPRH